MEINVRLEYKDFFKEEKKDILDYLKQISRDTLERFIGWSAVSNVELGNFFTDKKMSKCIQSKYCKLSISIPSSKYILMSDVCSLHLAEKILGNKQLLIDDNNLGEDVNRDEINLFKSILLINEELNNYDEVISNSPKEKIDKVIDMMISIKFSSYDLGMYDDVKLEISKLAIATLYKLKELIEFLKTDARYCNALQKLYESFGQKSLEEFYKRALYLCMEVCKMINDEDFVKFGVKDTDKATIAFFESLISVQQVVEKEDFINLRQNPLYKLQDGTYSIINPFFVLDKFTNSIRFLLKDDIDYSGDFSERFLMKNLLDDIFYKKYFIKRKEINNGSSEPDYYVRYNKDIFLFEYKDAFINAETKVSRDITKIEEELKKKFIGDKKAKGISQLINHIRSISDKKFQYDDLENQNYNIYPILLTSHRLLEVPGINYRMNSWFKTELQKENLDNTIKVKDLIIIDIDTLIYSRLFLKNKDRNFKDTLEEHIKIMKSDYKGYGKTEEEFKDNMYKKLEIKILPYSYRLGYNIITKEYIKEYVKQISDEK